MHDVLVLRLEGISYDNLEHFHFVGNFNKNISLLEDLGNPTESINSDAPGVRAKTGFVQTSSRLDTQGSGSNCVALPLAGLSLGIFTVYQKSLGLILLLAIGLVREIRY